MEVGTSKERLRISKKRIDRKSEYGDRVRNK